VVISRVLPLAETDTIEHARGLLFEAWREVGDRMGELQERYVLPWLDIALDLETLHGGS